MKKIKPSLLWEITEQRPVSLTEKERQQLARHLGERIAHLVEERFSSYGNFCRANGIPERLFYRIKKGGNPGLQTILLLAKALNVHPRELFDFDLSRQILYREDFKSWNEYYEWREKNIKQDQRQ